MGGQGPPKSSSLPSHCRGRKPTDVSHQPHAGALWKAGGSSTLPAQRLGKDADGGKWAWSAVLRGPPVLCNTLEPPSPTPHSSRVAPKPQQPHFQELVRNTGPPARPRPTDQNLRFSTIPRHLCARSSLRRSPPPRTWAKARVATVYLERDTIIGSEARLTELGTHDTSPASAPRAPSKAATQTSTGGVPRQTSRHLPTPTGHQRRLRRERRNPPPGRCCEAPGDSVCPRSLGKRGACPSPGALPPRATDDFTGPLALP